MKKALLKQTILSLTAALLLTACGGDSDGMGTTTSNQTDNNQNGGGDNVPSITVNGDQTVSLVIGDTFTDLGATVPQGSTVTTTSDLNTSKAGTYTITYTVTDAKGNTNTSTRTITVATVPSMAGTIPIDSNIELGGENNVLYYVDPRPEENGLNRALRINYEAMSFQALRVDGINPHSIDRAGESNRFYIRTQNSFSFDVINFDTQTVKTVPLAYKPRAIGAYNKKHNLQLLSALDMPVVGVIDVAQDKVIETVGIQRTFDPSRITSNAGSGSATGHAIWLDEDHFVLIDRVNRDVKVYKTTKNTDGTFSFKRTSSIHTGTALHALERVSHPRTRKDLVTFYALGEGDTTKNFSPYILELSFDPSTGVLSRTNRDIFLAASLHETRNVKPTSHHAGISPDGKYLVVPVFDGKVYFINRETMMIDKTVDARLGAAHIEFSAQENVAIITNHFDDHLTIIDMETLTTKKTLHISNHTYDPNNKHLLQPHFSYISPDGRYFYTFATQDGDFLKIDLQTYQIDKLHTGGAPEQAHS